MSPQTNGAIGVILVGSVAGLALCAILMAMLAPTKS